MQGKFMTFLELQVYFEFKLVFTVRHVYYLPHFASANCRFSHDVTKIQTTQLLILLIFYLNEV